MQTENLEELGETPEEVTRQVDVDVPAERVWEALTTTEGREQWLEDDPNRVIVVDHEEPGRRIAWWWFSDTEPARHVDIRVVGIPTGARVLVTETQPTHFPLTAMAMSCTPMLSVA
jgi:uncharacterized protein YndB with AHSA1/START domain